MRRRLRSAAIPLHRHSLPQLAIDGVLVALAYWLAYRLRFDRGVPERYAELRDATILPAVVAALVVFALFRMYEKWWRYVGQRDYVGILQAVVVTTLFLPAYVAVFDPVTARSAQGDVTLTIPTGVLAFFGLLLLLLVGG
ncbi:MAG TPA: polysaccharide biosynthesis protein, partial [Baekduia sp.]|nr:polysaccharide biosynthesis protein [Baekduia sp.]